MSTANRFDGSDDQVIETETEDVEEEEEAGTTTGSDSKSSLTGHVTLQLQQQPRPLVEPQPVPPHPKQHHQPHPSHDHHRHQQQQQQEEQEEDEKPVGGGERIAVRQRLAGLGQRLSAKASGCMRKVRRYRGGGGGSSGGPGGGGGSLPGPLARLRDAINERCCSSGDGGDSDRRRPWWNPFAGARWKEEMARLREDVRRIRFWRSVVGEFIGSLFLVLIGCGASVETDHVERPVTVRVALAFGVTYAAGLYCLHSDNDGHLNTAVTVAMAVTRRISVIRSVLYMATQLLGAVVGALALYWVTSDDYKTELGATRLSRSVSEGQGFLVEFFATSILVFVVFASYDDRNRDRTSMAPFVIGLTLMSVSLFSIPYTGGSMNTARSFGPAVVLNSWKNHWIYWFGPILGGVAGGLLHELLFSAGSSFRRVRKCLLRFERRRKNGSHNPSIASSISVPDTEEPTKTRKTEMVQETTRQKNNRSSVKMSADFEAAVDGSQRSWEQQSREDEEEEDDDDDDDEEEEEEEERQKMRRQRTATKDGEDEEGEEIEELSDEDDEDSASAAKSYLRRSSSYLKSVAGTSSQTEQQQQQQQVLAVPIVAAAKMRSSISTVSSSSSSSLNKTVISTLAEPKEEAATRLSIHSAMEEGIVIDGNYDDDDDDDDDEEFSGKGGTVASVDSSDSLEDV